MEVCGDGGGPVLFDRVHALYDYRHRHSAALGATHNRAVNEEEQGKGQRLIRIEGGEGGEGKQPHQMKLLRQMQAHQKVVLLMPHTTTILRRSGRRCGDLF